MATRRGFAAALLLAAAFSGCLGDDGADEPDVGATDEHDMDHGADDGVDSEPEPNAEPEPPDPEPEPIDTPAPPRPRALPPAPPALSFTDCGENVGVFPVLLEDAAALLPEGFAPVAFDPAGLLAQVAVVGFDCGNATGPGVLTTSVAELHVGIVVTPPEEYTSEGVSIYVVPLAVLSGDDGIAALYRSWGVPSAGHGATTVTTAPIIGDPAPIAVRAEQIGIMADGFGLTLSTAVEGPVETQAPGIVRAFLVSDTGTFDHVIDFSWTERSTIATGEALLQIEGSLAPFPLPVAPGIGIHNFDRGYAITLTYLSVDQLGPPAASGGSALPQADLVDQIVK